MSSPKKSLTRTTLINMGLRIALVIIAVTLLSYWHLMSVLQAQIQEQLSKYITERGQRESHFFKLAESHHALLKQEFTERYQRAEEKDPEERFNQLFEKKDDGTMRLRSEEFDGIKRPYGMISKGMGGFIGRGVTVTPELRRRLVIAYEVINTYGPAWVRQFQNFYLSAPENTSILYWPTVNWYAGVPGDMDFSKEEWFYIGDVKHNPKRETAWTGPYFESVSNDWYVTCVTPIEIEGRYVIASGNDIFLNELFKRTIDDHLEGTYNLIFRDDGRLILHPEHFDDIVKQAGNFNIAQANNPHLNRIFQLVTNKSADTVVVDNTADAEYLAVTRLQGPNWHFVTVYPKSLLAHHAFETARFILFLGTLSLLIEILVLFFVLRKQVAQPLQTFQKATEQLANGDFTVQLDTSRQDELGQLANSFETMARELRLREESLSTYNQQLSQEVEERKQIEIKLLEAKDLAEVANREKMASIGRLVAGFAHELNTPLGVAMGSASALQREAEKLNQLMTQEEVDVDELLAAVASIKKGFNLTLTSLDRVTDLVTSFKRTAVDQTSGNMRSFNVYEVINDTINLLSNRFKQTAIQIHVNCPEELKVKSLPGALEQILTNLLMNSLIHGFEEGQRAGYINLIVQLQENHLYLEYSDNGRGIKSEHLPKIFEPFFTTHRAHGGSGLGMYICYNLVTTQLQGTIVCESHLNGGVKFTIIFPI